MDLGLLTSLTTLRAGAGKLKKKLGKLGAMVEKKVLPVETDPQKLVSFVCGSNIYKEGEDIKLKPIEEYPPWLKDLYTGPAKKLADLDKDSKEYWIKCRKMSIVRSNRLTKLKK